MVRRPNRARAPSRHHERIVSIPSRFENVLKSSNDKTRAFGSSSNRFDHELQSRQNTFSEPGRHFKMSSFESKSTSFSAKGYGSGFISRSHRFRATPPSTASLCADCEDTLHPVHSSTFQDRYSRSTSFSKSTSRNERKQRMLTPGPGTYDQAMPELNGDRVRRESASFSSGSKRYFDSMIDRAERQNQIHEEEANSNATALDEQNKENDHDQRQNMVPFNSTSSRFHFQTEGDDDAIHRLLVQQSQHRNSRKINPFRCQRAIISTILREKALLVDQPGPTKYFKVQPAKGPAITSVFKSKTPKIPRVANRKRVQRGERSSNQMSINMKRQKQRHHFHLDLDRL